MLIVAIVVAVVIAGLSFAMSSQPDSFRMERSRLINAPADRLFGLVNDFRQWQQWSPWEKLDPAMQRTFTGPASGAGSSYAWAGNRKAGEGRMVIRESQPSDRVAIDLHFLKPFKASNLTEFTFTPEASGTRVTWTMSGANTAVTRAMSLVASMDKMVGKDFERGLANLADVAEASRVTS